MASASVMRDSVTTGCHLFTQDTSHLSNEPRAPDLLVTQTEGRRGRGTARGRAHGPRLLGVVPARPPLLAPRDPPLLASEDPPLLASEDPLPRPLRTHHPIPGGAKAMLVPWNCFTWVTPGVVGPQLRLLCRRCRIHTSRRRLRS